MHADQIGALADRDLAAVGHGGRLGGPPRPAGPDRPRRRCRHGDGLAHATRLPSHQTLRTAGPWPATCTRIRSARLPIAISPRSDRPTASAGAFVTVRIAAARLMAGTCS